MVVTINSSRRPIWEETPTISATMHEEAGWSSASALERSRFLDSSGKKIGEVALDAHPESFQLEKAGTRAFVNAPDRKEIEVVDLAKNAVIAKWPVTSALKNYRMALDEAHHRLLIGCREPARMLVFDTQTGKQTASIEIVSDTDDLFFDARSGPGLCDWGRWFCRCVRTEGR